MKEYKCYPIVFLIEEAWCKALYVVLTWKYEEATVSQDQIMIAALCTFYFKKRQRI